MADGFLMEVCMDSVESAINAERGGACRIERSSSLLEGGITPSIGLLQVVKQHVQIPVFAMIRPRGGDFLYLDREVEVMKRDIHLCKSHGADEVVLGALRGRECRHSSVWSCWPLHDPCRLLFTEAKGRIIVMPGGGITERNLQRILEGSGAQEFHCSARSSKDSAMKFRNSCVSMGAALSAPEYALSVRCEQDSNPEHHHQEHFVKASG